MNQRSRVQTWLLQGIVPLLVIVFVSLVLRQSFANQFGARQPAAIANFKVSGTRILDPHGKEFIIKGVNINGPNWVWPDDMTQPVHLNNIANCWKFNLVRVNSQLLPTGTYWQHNNDIDKLVQAFTSRKIVVLFDAHDRTGSYYRTQDGSLQALKGWYRNLATKYKNNPYVWFDVMNEPGDLPPVEPDWLTVHREVIKVIRDQVKSNNIIMVEGTAWGQDAGNWNAQPVPLQNSAILQLAGAVTKFDGKSYPNVIFNIHVYDQYNIGGNQRQLDHRLADYFDRVRAKNLVISVGEFGVRNANQNVWTVTQAMYRTAVPRNIGRIVWAWWGGDDNDLTTSGNGGGWHINSCTTPTNLSWLGRQVWQDTHRSSS